MQFLASSWSTARHSRLSLLRTLLVVFEFTELAVAYQRPTFRSHRELAVQTQVHRLEGKSQSGTSSQPRNLQQDAATVHIATVQPETNVGDMHRSLQQAPQATDPALEDPTAPGPAVSVVDRDNILLREPSPRNRFAQSPTSRTLDNLLPVFLIVGVLIMSVGIVFRARYVVKRRAEIERLYLERQTHPSERRHRQRQVPLAPLHGAGENEAHNAALLTPRGTRFRPMHEEEEVSEGPDAATSVFYDVDSPTDGEPEERTLLTMQTASWRGSLGLGQQRMLSIGSFRGHSQDLESGNASVDDSSAPLPLPPVAPLHFDAGGGSPSARTYRRTASQTSRPGSRRPSRSVTGGMLDFGQRIWSTDVSGALDE